MNFTILKDEQKEPDAIRKWHDWIHAEKQRGDRARLRRCDSLQQVMMQPAFYWLARSLPRLESYALNGVALVAGLLVWVESASNQDLSLILGNPKSGSDMPRFSELRFQRLLASKEPEEFFQSMRRAIVQAGKTADPILLADEILHWEAQQRQPDWYTGARQWQYRFAKSYYTHTS